MKKLLMLMFLITNLHAKEYTFSCVNDNKKLDQASTSLIINSAEKKMIFGKANYDLNWIESDVEVSAKCNSKEMCRIMTITFNKITGKLVSTADRDSAFSDIVLTSSCKQSSRLMP